MGYFPMLPRSTTVTKEVRIEISDRQDRVSEKSLIEVQPKLKFRRHALSNNMIEFQYCSMVADARCYHREWIKRARRSLG